MENLKLKREDVKREKMVILSRFHVFTFQTHLWQK